MIKEFIFTIGLPGSGKSTYLDKQYTDRYGFESWASKSGILKMDNDDFERFMSSCENHELLFISADETKPYLVGYTDEHPEVVHEESVQLAKRMVLALAAKNSADWRVIMDGGAINNHYTQGIISSIRTMCPNAKITALFFDTPIEVCLERIETRGRKVPVKAIYEKNQKLINCVNKYRTMVDDFIRVDYYKNKYIILDMDGTLAGYSKVRFDDEGNADFVNGEFFLHLRPNKSVIEFVKEHYDMENVYICSACANIIAWQEKMAWLDKYFPEIPVEHRLWCGNKDYKHVFIKQFAIHQGWKRNEVVLIDDYHPIIEKCKKISINCLHPSNIEVLTDPYAVFS